MFKSFHQTGHDNALLLGKYSMHRGLGIMGKLERASPPFGFHKMQQCIMPSQALTWNLSMGI